MNLALIKGLLVLGLAGCGSEPPGGPTPPVPSPEPTPPPPAPPGPISRVLEASGSRFVVGGEEAWLAGVIGCCGSASWPLVDQQELELYAAHGANYTHIRVGPFHDHGFELIEAVPPLLSYAQQVGIYMEVDVIDGWAAKKKLLAWPNDGCEIFQDTPRRRHEEWIRRVARTTGSFPNVIYQVGNENGVCQDGTTQAWEWGVRAILVDELRRMGVGPRLVGTNSEDPNIERGVEYASYHQPQPAHPAPWPVQVNEYNPGLRPEVFKANLEQASREGTYYHLWRGSPPQSEQDFMASLRILKEWRASHPTPK